MLVRDGRLSHAQVDSAIAQQARVGARLGTVLIEMRLIDADTLTVYLGLDLGIPIATRAALERAKRAAVRVVAPELAERFLCVPLVVQDRQLVVAMRDPHDLLALDELATSTGYRIIPRVAPEARLFYFLERYYGIPRPERFRLLGDLAIAGSPRGVDYVEPPPPPLPGLPPQMRNPIPAPSAPPPLRAAPPPAEDDELARELEAAQEAPAEAAPVRRPTRPPPPPTAAPSPPPEEATVEILALPAAIRRIEAATTRSEIADALMSFSRGLFDVAALLVVRDELAFGWKGFGRGLDLDRLETLLVPIEQSPLFKGAVEDGKVHAGAPTTNSLHAHLYKVLKSPAPKHAAVAPIRIKERVVNLLYGHSDGDRALGEAELAQLTQIVESAAAGYVRLIALSKQSTA
jgi:Type II secretion system (T2SS), protein E, N-terminal domain